MDITILLTKFPLEWRGVFEALHLGDTPVLQASLWLRQQTSCHYGHSLAWQPFVTGLCEEEPLSRGRSLLFHPRIFHFPTQLRHRLVAFIHHHRAEVPSHVLEKFLDCMEPFHRGAAEDYWTRMLMSSLRAHIRNKANFGPEDSYLNGVLTTEGEGLLGRICNSVDELQKTAETMPPHLPSSTNRLLPSLESQTQCSSQSEDEDPNEVSEGVPNKRQKLGSPVLSSGRKEADSESLLDADTQVKITKLREAWSAATSHDEEASKAGLKLFVQLPPVQIEAVCQMLDLSSLSDASTALACQQIIGLGQEISFSNCTCFAQYSILPKVECLSQNASRVLQAACTSMAKCFPGQITQAVLRPLLSSSNIGTCQADMVCKILKESLAADHQLQALLQLLDNEAAWTGPMLQVVQLLLQAKLALDNSQTALLLTRLEGNSLANQKNLKFGKLIQAVICQYGHQLPAEQRRQLSHVVHTHETFRRALLAAMKKLGGQA